MFQENRSVSVRLAPKELVEPAAAQAADDVQDRPDRLPPGPPGPDGAGIGCITHAVPFHAAARGARPLPPVKTVPAAAHARAAVHDTPVRELPAPPPAAGNGWIAHLVPFQRSTSAAAAPPAGW
jgi:hypothetical protein